MSHSSSSTTESSSELTKMGGILQILFANLIIIMDFLCDDNNNSNGKCRPHWSLLLRSSAMIVSGAGWIVKDGQDGRLLWCVEDHINLIYGEWSAPPPSRVSWEIVART